MKKLSVVVLGLALMGACGEREPDQPAPPGGITETTSAITFPSKGVWYAEYSTTKVNCGIFTLVDNHAGNAAVLIFPQPKVVGAPLTLTMQRDPEGWDHILIGGMPDPGHRDADANLCIINLQAPADWSADLAGILRGSWVLPAGSGSPAISCASMGFGPLGVNVLPGDGGYWADFQLHPQFYGYSFSARGVVLDQSLQPTGCTWSVVSNLYAGTNPVQP